MFRIFAQIHSKYLLMWGKAMRWIYKLYPRVTSFYRIIFYGIRLKIYEIILFVCLHYLLFLRIITFFFNFYVYAHFSFKNDKSTHLQYYYYICWLTRICIVLYLKKGSKVNSNQNQKKFLSCFHILTFVSWNEKCHPHSL
jgi:hypothetical protein